MNYELHPLCTLFPRMQGAEFTSLVSDIKVNGQRQPIILHEGMILDGGNRYRACVEAGVTPEFVEHDGSNLVSFVLSANMHRRHMTPGQQAAIVASAQDWASAQTVGKPKSCNLAPLATSEARAAESGASLRTQKHADKVAKADPELSRKVAHGEISLPKAVEKISGKRPGSKPKNKPTAKPEPVEEYDPSEDELASAHQTVLELAEENDALKDRLACEVMPGCDDDKTAALTTLKELRATIKAMEAELDAVKVSRDKYMRENAEMKSQMAMQRKEIAKLKGGK